MSQDVVVQPSGSEDCGPGTPIPPMSLFFIGFGLAFLAQQRLPLVALLPADLTPLRLVLGWLLIAGGVAVFWWGMATFARLRTGILLQRRATRVVTVGPYRWSRNPMYVGCVTFYLGAALLTNMWWPLVLLPLVILVLQLVVIAREERYMRRRFGHEYVEYCRRVRRWI